MSLSDLTNGDRIEYKVTKYYGGIVQRQTYINLPEMFAYYSDYHSDNKIADFFGDETHFAIRYKGTIQDFYTTFVYQAVRIIKNKNWDESPWQ